MSSEAGHATRNSRHANVIVVGAGAFGLFTALALAEAGKSVVILDRGAAWSEASAVNAGSLAVQNKLPALVPYTLWAWDIWLHLAKQLGCDVGVRRTGGYKVATSPEEAVRLEKIAQEQESNELVVRKSVRTNCVWKLNGCRKLSWRRRFLRTTATLVQLCSDPLYAQPPAALA